MKPKLITLALTFICGALLGAAVCCRFYHAHPWNALTSERHYSRILERFNKKLHLTPDQKKQVHDILEGSRKNVEALRAEIKPKFEDIRNKTNADIRNVLNPDQQKKFDEMRAEWEKKWRKRQADMDK